MLLKNALDAASLKTLVKIVCFMLLLWAANICYGYMHEAAHAFVVEALGGKVYEIYVNPLGTDAHTIHSAITGELDDILLELAGMIMTTGIAFMTLRMEYAPLTLFMSLRTSIYALNYAPGTDISNVYLMIGSASMLFSLLLVALNLACAAIAISVMLKRYGFSDPFSTLAERLLHL